MVVVSQVAAQSFPPESNLAKQANVIETTNKAKQNKNHCENNAELAATNRYEYKMYCVHIVNTMSTKLQSVVDIEQYGDD